jgi:hypothetical protein
VEAPQAYKNAGIANLVGGGISLMYNGMMFLSTFWMCVGFYFLIPMAASAYAAYIGFQMYSGNVTPAAKNGTIAGIVGGIFSFNIISAAASGFAFMQLGNDEVVGWLEQNGVS